jgi:hypothetical protein
VSEKHQSRLEALLTFEQSLWVFHRKVMIMLNLVAFDVLQSLELILELEGSHRGRRVQVSAQ